MLGLPAGQLSPGAFTAMNTCSNRAMVIALIERLSMPFVVAEILSFGRRINADRGIILKAR